IGSNQGRTRSKTTFFPPTIKVRVPFSAPAFEPVQGASRKSMPDTNSFSAIWRLSLGEIVLQSAMTRPFFAPAARPSLPKITSRDIDVSPTQRNTQSLSSATSRGVAHALLPSASALPLLYDQSATSWPAPKSRFAMGPPMMPSPRNTSFAILPCSLRTQFCLFLLSGDAPPSAWNRYRTLNGGMPLSAKQPFYAKSIATTSCSAMDGTSSWRSPPLLV